MSRRYLCLACWRASELEATFYRCPACEEVERPEWLRPGGDPPLRPVRELRGRWWTAFFAGDKGRTAIGEAPRCPRHPETEIRLFCECRHPLSERVALRSGTPLGLAIAGPTGAGKTVHLITMMHKLHRLGIGDHKLGVVGLEDTEERFHRLSAELFDGGRKPGRSPEGRTPEAAGKGDAAPPAGHFGWAVSIEGARGRRRRPELLAIQDLDGAAWGLPAHVRQPRLDRYLDHLRALIFLIDGRAVAADLGHPPPDAWDPAPPTADRGAAARQGFSRVEERLGRRARRVDLALVISKTDGLWQHDEWRGLYPGGTASESERRRLVEDILLRSRRRDVVIAARQKFRQVQLFAASSLGFLPTPEDVGGGRLRRPVEPAGVAEPLEWLLRRRLAGL